MRKTDLECLSIKGDIAYRAVKNLARVQSKWYKPEMVFKADPGSWPGDWEGRTILALVLLAQTTHCEPAYLDEILEKLEEKVNTSGYLGSILPPNEVDEQQLSGHNWLLRGLIEHYLWKKDLTSKNRALMLIKSLYLPVRGKYTVYPMNKEERIFGENKSGAINGKLGGWHISSDVGCAYMSLDGLAQAYDVFRIEDLVPLLEEMIETFMSIDLVEMGMQTHASLTAARGILRYYQATKNPLYLTYARKVFDTYVRWGMTENYSNYNWFSHPLWTEPCAIVDSYMLAFGLFEATKESSYLDISQKIYYNGIGRAQRMNGGFGCDCCVGPEHLSLSYHGDNMGEAYWCCTMRGGEGLSRIVENSLRIDGDTMLVPHYHTLKYEQNEFVFEEKSHFPEEGKVYFHIRKNNDDPVRYLELYIPEYAKNAKITHNGKTYSTVNRFEKICLDRENDIVLDFEIPLIIKETQGECARKDCFTLWHGDLLLGVRLEQGKESVDPNMLIHLGKGSYQDKDSGRIFTRIDGEIDLEMADIHLAPLQILFKK